MNQYQSQLNKEVKQRIRDIGIDCDFRKARRNIKFWIKFNRHWGTPCEDCDNSYCRNPKNKIFYCRDNR